MKYTEREDWLKYWQEHSFSKINSILFEEYLKFLPSKGKLLEIGGFPGTMAAYLMKRFKYDTTILDYIIDKDVINKVEKLYNLEYGSLKTIETDIFSYSKEDKFDLVISNGFIEHFENWREVIKIHYDLLTDKGLSVIIVPNFLGLNGLYQRLFDKDNLKKHNLESMKLVEIKKYLTSLKSTNLLVSYIGKPSIWIEPTSKMYRYINYLTIYINKILRRMPLKNNKFLAPYIILIISKNNDKV